MEKLSKIITELKAPKGQFNKFGGYKYRSCEDILEAIKPLLDGAILTLSDEIIVIGDRFYVKATATFKDKGFEKATTAFAREPVAKKGMDESQITGMASSYARKYALNGLFCIDDTKDADSMDNTDKKPAHIDDFVPYAEPEMLSLDDFISRAEKCATIGALQNLINSQRGNPQIQEMARVATARKKAIMGAQDGNL